MGGFSLITVRKRSLGQGNIFAPVCHSVHRGGGGTAQSVMGDTVNARAVRILLECNLAS